MGRRRNTPRLLAAKLLAIREYLQASQTHMQKLPNLPHSGLVSEYENGVRLPSLQTILAYSNLRKVTMNLMADDAVSLEHFQTD
jgi:hypothetical protein